MTHPLSPLAVYCGSAWGARPEYRDAARELGAEMAALGIDLVYGGGRLGLMGEIADAVLAGGGGVLGVITHELKHKEVAHEGLGELRVVETMHERKKAMADVSKGFVALAGGVGTLDELFEIVAWSQLAIHDHPVGLLNTAGYYDDLLRFLEHANRERFLRIDPHDMLVVDSDPRRLLVRMAEKGPPVRRAWAREP